MSNKIDFTIQGGIFPILQRSPNTCWAATTAVLLSWKNQASITDIVATTQAGTAPDGEKYVDKLMNDKILLSDHQEDYFSKFDFGTEAPANYIPEGIEELLREYGPLWVANDEDNGQNPMLYHYRIIYGIYGDGTVDNTFLKIIDPLRKNPIEERYSVFVAKYEQLAIESNEYNWELAIQIIHFK